MKRLAAIACLCAHAALAQSGDGPVRLVEFAWPQVDDASAYELEFASEGAQPLSKRVDKNAWKGELPVGKYQLRVRSKDQRGVPGKWGKPIPLTLAYPPVEPMTPENAAKITGAAKTADVRFAWKPFPTAARYRVEVKGEDGTKVSVKEVDGGEAVINLATAKRYLWAVTAMLPDGTPGDAWKEDRDLTLLGPQLPTPKVTAALKKDEQLVKWSGAPGAASYRIKIDVEAKPKGKAKKGKVWRAVLPEQETDERNVELKDDWPSGRYRVRLVAMAPMRAESAPAELIFKREAEAAAAAVKSGRVVTPRQRFIARYIWLPHTRNIVLVGDRARIAVPSGVMNAHDVGLAWRMRPKKSGLLAGAELDAVIVRSQLFGEEQAEAGSDQEELRVDALNTRAMLSAGYQVWYLGVMAHAGFEQRQLGTLFPASLTAFDFSSAKVSDPLVGGSLAAIFAAEKELSLSYLTAMGTTRGDFEEYRRSIIHLMFTHRILGERMALGYGVVNDETQYAFVSEEGDAYTQSWSEARFNLSVGYLF